MRTFWEAGLLVVTGQALCVFAWDWSATCRRWLAPGAVVLAGVAALGQTGPMPGYDQPFRPQVHFSPRRHWTNDPNGLVYFEGEYHLFFQYNPEGDTWGHMSWGHAVSTDLLHWQELPVAIPEHGDEMIFTGSVVADEHNSSGFCEAGKPCLVAIFTTHKSLPEKKQREMQSLAYSLDRGRTWKLYEGNPVLDLQMANFRDPGVFWDEERKQWVMAVALPDDHKVQLYRSDNLKQWTLLSTFGPEGATGGQWECPDLVRLPEHDGVREWVLKVGLNPGSLQGGSGEQYFLGRFDGKAFAPLTGAQAHGWSDYGKDAYCAISFNHLPAGQPPILLGWMNNWQYANELPNLPWRGQMTLPRHLAVASDAAGSVLRQEVDVERLRVGGAQDFAVAVGGGEASGEALHLKLPFELTAKFNVPAGQMAGVRFYSDDTHWTEIGFDRKREVFYMDRTHAGLEVSAQFPVRTEAPLDARRPATLHLVADRSSMEAFAQDGTIAMTNLIFPASEQAAMKVFGDGKKASITVMGRAWGLESIWSGK